MAAAKRTSFRRSKIMKCSGECNPGRPEMQPADTVCQWTEHRDAGGALAALELLYEREIARLLEGFADYQAGRLKTRVRAVYPAVRLRVSEGDVNDVPTMAAGFGFADQPGVYQGTFTRLGLFHHHLAIQFAYLLRNQDGPIEVGLSEIPIPLPFAFAGGMVVGDGFDAAAMTQLRQFFDMPSLALMDDRIVNGEHADEPDGLMPLALFTAPRVDYSLQRLNHYCGTRPEDFQNFVLFTNYTPTLRGPEKGWYFR